jgi:hypothetical protein
MTATLNATALIDGRCVGTRLAAAKLMHRHPDLIRRRCQPVAFDTEGRALYDLDEVQAVFSKVKRRERLTDA